MSCCARDQTGHEPADRLALKLARSLALAQFDQLDLAGDCAGESRAAPELRVLRLRRKRSSHQLSLLRLSAELNALRVRHANCCSAARRDCRHATRAIHSARSFIRSDVGGAKVKVSAGRAQIASVARAAAERHWRGARAGGRRAGDAFAQQPPRRRCKSAPEPNQTELNRTE